MDLSDRQPTERSQGISSGTGIVTIEKTVDRRTYLRWGERTRSCQKAVVVKAEAMLQHSKKCSNGRQFLECESEAVAFATTPVTPVNISHNLVLASRSSQGSRDQKKRPLS